MTKQSPEVIEVNTQQMEEVLKRVSDKMDEDDALLLRRIVESYGYVSDLVEDKRTTIARLRKLFFGARSEKTKDIVGDPEDGQEAVSPCSDNLPEARSENELPDGDSDVGSTKPQPSSSYTSVAGIFVLVLEFVFDRSLNASYPLAISRILCIPIQSV